MPAKAGTQDRRHRGGGPWVPAFGNVIQFKAGGLTASGPKTTVRISPLMRSVGELATSKRAQRRQKCHFPNARMALANWITAPFARGVEPLEAQQQPLTRPVRLIQTTCNWLLALGLVAVAAL